MSQFYELPEGWEEISLGEILKEGRIGLVRSASQQNLSEGIPYVRMQHYDLQGNWKFQDLTRVDATDEELKTYELCSDDILFNTRNSFELVGKVAIWPHDKEGYIYNNNLMRLRFFKETLPKWIAYQMIAPKFRNNLEGAKSATTSVCAVYGKELVKQKLLLSPLNEQRRIVEKIEALTVRSRKARAALDQIPALLDQFRQSVLAAAFRGDLTADWRAQNPDVEPAEALLERISVSQQNPRQVFQEIGRLVEILPKGWTWTKLKTIVPHIQAGKNFSCPEIPVNDGTVGMVKISAVTWGRFNPRETKTVIDESKIDPNLFIKKGDFLISRANTAELVGASVIVDNIQHRIMLSDKVWRVDFVNEIDKRYVNFFLKSGYGRKEIESRATGNQLSMRNISQKLFQDIVIPLPPHKEQEAIADEIERLFHLSERVKQQRYDAEADLAQLDQSILAKAFRGELVPQDPTDEPATVLLDRIRAEREQLGGGKKRGKAKA